MIMCQTASLISDDTPISHEKHRMQDICTTADRDADIEMLFLAVFKNTAE